MEFDVDATIAQLGVLCNLLQRQQLHGLEESRLTELRQSCDRASALIAATASEDVEHITLPPSRARQQRPSACSGRPRRRAQGAAMGEASATAGAAASGAPAEAPRLSVASMRAYSRQLPPESSDADALADERATSPTEEEEPTEGEDGSVQIGATGHALAQRPACSR